MVRPRYFNSIFPFWLSLKDDPVSRRCDVGQVECRERLGGPTKYDHDAAVRASCVEFVLAGLYASDRISRNQTHGTITYEFG